MSTASASGATREFKNHELDEDFARPGVRYEKRPAQTPDGKVVPGLYNVWIWLDNPGQFNSYTTDMVNGVILAFRAASNARPATASASRSCTAIKSATKRASRT